MSILSIPGEENSGGEKRGKDRRGRELPALTKIGALLRHFLRHGARQLCEKLDYPAPCARMSGKQTNIFQRIEIELDRERRHFIGAGAGDDLGEIGVLLPANAGQQRAIGGVDADEVASAAVVRAEDGPTLLQTRECGANIFGAEFRT